MTRGRVGNHRTIINSREVFILSSLLLNFSSRVNDGFRILSQETSCLSVSNPFTEVRIMKRMIGLLMVMGLWSGCGKEIEVVKETQPSTGKLIGEYEIYRDDKTNKPVKHGYYKS